MDFDYNIFFLYLLNREFLHKHSLHIDQIVAEELVVGERSINEQICEGLVLVLDLFVLQYTLAERAGIGELVFC